MQWGTETEAQAGVATGDGEQPEGPPHGQREHTVQHLCGRQVGNDFENYLQMSITFPLGFYTYDFLLEIQSASVHGAPKPGIVLGAGIRTVHRADKKGSVFSKLAF